VPSALVQPSSHFDVDLSPCRASIQPMSQQRAYAAGTDVNFACFASLLPLAHIPDHSVN